MMQYYAQELQAEEQQARRRHVEAAWPFRSTVDRMTCDFTRKACTQGQGCAYCDIALDRAAQEKAEKP